MAEIGICKDGRGIDPHYGQSTNSDVRRPCGVEIHKFPRKVLCQCKLKNMTYIYVQLLYNQL